MAPPAVFSYLRGQHRRNQSSPTSPQFNQWQTFPSSSRPDPGNPSSPYRHAEDETLVSPSPISPLPPTLPPIPRVASQRNPSLDESSKRQMDFNKQSRGESLPHYVDEFTPQSRQPAQVFYYDSGRLYPQAVRASGQPQMAGHEPPFITRARTEDFSRSSHQNSSNPPRFYGAEERSDVGGVGWKHSDHPAYRQKGLRKPGDTSKPSFEHAARPLTPSNNRTQGDFQSSVNKSANSSPPPSSSSSSFQKASGTFSLESSHYPVNLPSKPSKAKTLLQPISLFMRRRTSHSIDPSAEETLNRHRNLSVPAMTVPDDYDPRIKGKGVHDFSAPRPRRDFSNEGKSSVPPPIPDGTSEHQYGRRESPPTVPNGGVAESISRTPEIQHTPVFVEDFNDNHDTAASSSAINRENLANSSFLARWSKTNDPEALSLGYHSKSTLTDDQSTLVAPGDRSSRNTDAPSWRTSSDQSTVRSSISNDTRSTSPTQSPTKPESRSSAYLDPVSQLSMAPQRIASGASRFSFQMNSDRSVAQEKALEDKHKQKAASKAMLEATAPDRLEEESDEEDFDDYDDMDDDLEEPIPGVNVDADEDEDITLVPQGEPASIQEIQSQDQNRFFRPALETRALMNGLNITNLQDVHPLLREQYIEQHAHQASSNQNPEDDMYFDDGIIEAPDEDDQRGFDENVFDLPTKSHYDLPERPKNTLSKRRLNNPNGLKIVTQGSQPTVESIPRQISSDDEEYLKMSSKFGAPVGGHQVSMKQNGHVLSQERLAAYQTALANAANTAAAEGRFERKNIVGTIESKFSSLNGFKNYDYTVNENDYGGLGAYEDDPDADDDPLVAVANAEALANDDEGFYGREFGFLNGEAGSDSLGRSMSGHNACKEPNLTPITERSEFSTRNSFISLNTWNNNPSGTFPAPGLAQIAAGLRDEEDMTLSQFIDLRRKTFGAGGSSASLAGSTNSSPTSSTAAFFGHRPDSSRAPNNNSTTATTTTMTHTRVPSLPDTAAARRPDALWARASEPSSPALTNPSAGASSASPTSPHHAAGTSAATLLHSPITPSSPASAGGPKFPTRRSWHRHSTSSGGQSVASVASAASAAASGAPPSAFATAAGAGAAAGVDRDSVAYVQEQDMAEPGGMRWILERRRTEETGEVRVVGRTVVEGGRI